MLKAIIVNSKLGILPLKLELLTHFNIGEPQQLAKADCNWYNEIFITSFTLLKINYLSFFIYQQINAVWSLAVVLSQLDIAQATCGGFSPIRYQILNWAKAAIMTNQFQVSQLKQTAIDEVKSLSNPLIC